MPGRSACVTRRCSGVGAYATAILTHEGGDSLFDFAPARGLVYDGDRRARRDPGASAQDIYLAIATLGFGVVLQKIIFEWRSLTGGGGGLALTAPNIGGYEVGATGLYYLTLAS